MLNTNVNATVAGLTDSVDFFYNDFGGSFFTDFWMFFIFAILGAVAIAVIIKFLKH